VAELGELGVARVSVGGAFNAVALGAVVDAARELLDSGTYGYSALAAKGRALTRTAFSA
jgi:2-methylisocitrate lyase-like PEP mutase family enzyme